MDKLQGAYNVTLSFCQEHHAVDVQHVCTNIICKHNGRSSTQVKLSPLPIPGRGVVYDWFGPAVYSLLSLSEAAPGQDRHLGLAGGWGTSGWTPLAGVGGPAQTLRGN